MGVTRRRFLQSAAIGAGAAAVGGPALATGTSINLTKPLTTLLGGPRPRTNVNHVVVAMMENRSVDHYLGWWGETEGVDFDAATTLDGRVTQNFGASGLGNFHGHPFGDPSHNHRNGRRQIIDDSGDGTPDGWGADLDTGTDEYALSYYLEEDLPVLGRMVRDFTSFDRYFCSWMGNTYPNRYYMHSAQAHGIDNNDFPPERAGENPDWLTGFDWPTLWDQLTAAGVTWKYYFSNIPAIALFGGRHLHNTRPITEYYADCAAGTLPQVSFVDPFFVAPEGLSNDDHPHADIRLGQEFYSDITTAFMRSRCWRSGAMFLTYDEWGGFFDHVTPPVVGHGVDPFARFGDADARTTDYRRRSAVGADGQPLHDGPADFGLYGFRVPTMLLSPYARAAGTVGRTNHDVHDHTTILQFICDNWALPSTGAWDPGASRVAPRSMLSAFDPAVLDEGNPGDPEVDVDAYEYVAPPSARENLGSPVVPPGSVSELWRIADWIEDQGVTITTRFADALPFTR